ncbi:MAG: sulfotransferase, partial [Cyanobacteria bacterium QH_7_48_89]
QEIGQQWLNNLAKAIEKAMKVRQMANSEQFYDLDYQDLVSDPVGTVRRIYDYFDYSLSPELENNLKAWIANHPQHKYGPHHYTLEQFGLDAEIVNARFSNYRERFNIA